MKIENVFLFKYLILIAIFLPLRQADLTASASLQGIRSEGPRLMSSRGAKRRGDLIVLRIHMRLPRSLAVARNDATSSTRE
jgi:hypothetical protein